MSGLEIAAVVFASPAFISPSARAFSAGPQASSKRCSKL